MFEHHCPNMFEHVWWSMSPCLNMYPHGFWPCDILRMHLIFDPGFAPPVAPPRGDDATWLWYATLEASIKGYERGMPKKGCFVMENLLKLMIFGVPLFQEPPFGTCMVLLWYVNVFDLFIMLFRLCGKLATPDESWILHIDLSILSIYCRVENVHGMSYLCVRYHNISACFIAECLWLLPVIAI